MSITSITYVTYQTFPAETANSQQTMSNIKYFVKNGVPVSIYFPLREGKSSANLQKIQDFYKNVIAQRARRSMSLLPRRAKKVFPQAGLNRRPSVRM